MQSGYDEDYQPSQESGLLANRFYKLLDTNNQIHQIKMRQKSQPRRSLTRSFLKRPSNQRSYKDLPKRKLIIKE